MKRSALRLLEVRRRSFELRHDSQVLSAAFDPNALNSATFDAKLTFAMGGKKNSVRANGAYE